MNYLATIVVNHNRFPEIRRKLPNETKQVVQATVLHILAAADPPVDTGNLKNNTTVTENSVTWNAPYAGFVNFGTYKMHARPFVDEAVAQVQPMFLRAMEALAKSL